MAVYGGSFNPVHNGHTSIARAICDTGVVDEVWFMVSPLNPLKQNVSSQVLPTDLRLKMAQLAVGEVGCLRVSDFENNLPIPSYTFTTLSELAKAYPQHEFALIVGQDNWERFPQWFKGEQIKATHDIIVYGRNESVDTAQDNEQAQFAQVVLNRKDGSSVILSDEAHPFPLYDISSTQIRKAFQNRDLQFAAKWLHPDVFRFILENALYQ